MKSVFLEGENVTLRPLEVEDAEFIQELVMHPEVRPYLGRAPEPVSEEGEKEYIREETEDSDHVHFLIEYEEEKAGHIFLGGLEKDFRKSGVGYSVHPDFHGRGIGTEALKLVTKYAFETLNRHKIRGAYLGGNTASKRLMEKAGFQEEGLERDFKYVDGNWKDAHWMSILETEYFED